MYVRQLANLLSQKTAEKSDKLPQGIVDGNFIIIGHRRYRAIWTADQEAIDGQTAECLVDGQKCVVMLAHD